MNTLEPLNADVKEKILDASQDILAEYGILLLNVNMISRAVNISEAEIYKYTSSIDIIIASLFIRSNKSIVKKISELKNRENPELALRYAVEWILNRHLGPGMYSGLTEKVRISKAQSIDVLISTDEAVDALDDLIQKNKMLGNTKSLLNTRKLAENILITARSSHLYEKARSENLDLPQLRDDILRSIFNDDGKFL